MSTDFEKGLRKTIDLSVKSKDFTVDVLKSALNDFLSGKSNCDNINKNISHLKSLEDVVISILDKEHIDYLRNGTNQLPGNVNLSFKGVGGEMLLHRLDLKGICISTGSACDSQNQKATHVIEAIGVPDEYKFGTIRLSFGSENTVDDAKVIANAIISIIKG